MNIHNNPIKSRQSQRGATLIVALVILTIVTVLGLASMRNSNLELKMASSSRDHSVAFQNAESALLLLERQMAATPYTRDQIESGCASASGCFTDTCANGLCFDGELDAFTKDLACKIAKGTEQPKQMWRDESVWTDAAKHNVIEIPSTANATDATQNNEVKYIVEFLCFVKKPGEVASDNDRGYPLYRLTVRAEGEAQRSTAVLQSVYRGALLTYAPGA